MKRVRLTACLVTLAAGVAALPAVHAAGPGRAGRAAPDADLARYVDPMIGTSPPGFVFPGAVAPFGMIQNSPDTTGQFAYSGYLYTDPIMRGFSLVHLSGPGVKKGGDIPFMPFLGPAPTGAPDANVYGTTFDHATEVAQPGYYAVTVAGPATRVELTAGTRAAMQRYTFPPSPTAHLLIDVARSVEGVVGSGKSALRIVSPTEVAGYRIGRYPVHFVARFDRPFASSGAYGVTFDTTASQTVTARMAISFVDEDGARANLDAEAPATLGFDEMRAATRTAWNQELNLVKVGGPNTLDADLRSFYTALYHSFIHPNTFEDVDRRYRGADGQVHIASGPMHFANFSSWDTYRAQNQLLSLLQPTRMKAMLAALLRTYREAGKLPRWGEHSFDASHMSGDPIIPFIADAACRGLLDDDPVLAAGLYEGAVALRDRRDPVIYSKGYLPNKPGTTLEYGVGDFSLALLADRLGRPATETERWLADSLRYRNIFDPETKWVRPRNADGSWYSPFEPSDETGFQEGNSWQYSWLAMHDTAGVVERMGGVDTARQRLDILFAAPPEAQNRTNGFGVVYRTPQYAPGNEHDLEIPWLYPWVGQPWKSQKALASIRTLFRDTVDGLPGNDDLGSLSPWHVYSAMGFGPVTPGAPFYVVGSPQFAEVNITLENGKQLEIRAPGANLASPYVQSASLGGKPLDAAWFTEKDLLKGGTLTLPMGPFANTTWATSPSAAPPSVTGSTNLESFGC